MAKYFPEGNPKDGYNLYAYSVGRRADQDSEAMQRQLCGETIMREATICMMWRCRRCCPAIRVNTSPTNHRPLQQMQLQKWEGNGWTRFGNIIQGANI